MLTFSRGKSHFLLANTEGKPGREGKKGVIMHTLLCQIKHFHQVGKEIDFKVDNWAGGSSVVKSFPQQVLQSRDFT